jgi:hypothetical protein
MELHPCPYCGSRDVELRPVAEIRREVQYDKAGRPRKFAYSCHRVCCNHCGTLGPQTSEHTHVRRSLADSDIQTDRRNALNLWNTRHSG